MLGYICVWGTTPREKVTDAEGVTIRCGGCGEVTRMIGMSVTPYCSIFYIPLCPEGGGEEFIQCTSCGGKFQGSAAQIRTEQAREMSELADRIERKRREYEAHPEAVETGCELVELRMAAGQAEEGRALAESLARDHPNDANTRFLLGQVLMSIEQWGRAREELEGSVTLNPQHAGAHYQLAILFASRPAPNLHEALRAARTAGHCGHPQARALADAIESEIAGQD